MHLSRKKSKLRVIQNDLDSPEISSVAQLRTVTEPPGWNCDGSISLSGALWHGGQSPIILETTQKRTVDPRLICDPPNPGGCGQLSTTESIPADHRPCHCGLEVPRHPVRDEITPLYPNLTIDVHVRTAASLHQSFLWLHPIQA